MTMAVIYLSYRVLPRFVGIQLDQAAVACCVLRGKSTHNGTRNE